MKPQTTRAVGLMTFVIVLIPIFASAQQLSLGPLESTAHTIFCSVNDLFGTNACKEREEPQSTQQPTYNVVQKTAPVGPTYQPLTVETSPTTKQVPTVINQITNPIQERTIHTKETVKETIVQQPSFTKEEILSQFQAQLDILRQEIYANTAQVTQPYDDSNLWKVISQMNAGAGSGGTTDTDDQTLSLASNTLSIVDGNSVDLSSYLDNTDTLTDLSCGANEIPKWNGTAWACAADLSGGVGGTDDQTIDTFTLSSNTLSLSIEDDGEAVKTIDLSAYLDDTNTTYTAGTGLTLTGTTFSNDLGTTIESSEITDNTITAADLFVTGNGTSGQVLTSDADGSFSWTAKTTDTNTQLSNAQVKTAYEANADTNAFTDAEQTKLGNIEASADVTDTANVTSAGALMDSEVDADIKTLSLPANSNISGFGATVIDDADAATARTTLGVDAAGTDNSTDVTLAGALDYLTIVGQVITRNAIDLAADITGVLGLSNGGTGASTSSGARTNLGLAIGSDIQAYNANTTLLGQTIESSEITDNTVSASDLFVTGDGTAGQVLTSDADGSFSWTAKTTDTNTQLTEEQVEDFAGSLLGGTETGLSVTYQDSTNDIDFEVTGVLQDLNTLGAPASDGEFLVATGAGAFAYESGATVLTSLGLGSVENTALSTWAGTSNITTLGTIGTGVWNGTAIDFSTYTNATASTGITFTGDAISTTLGTAIDTGEITNGTILTADLNLTDITLSDFTNDPGFLTSITAQSIKSLSDVYSSMTPTDGQILTYDTTNGWQSEINGAPTTILGLTDTPAGYGTSDQVLLSTGTGTQWGAVGINSFDTDTQNMFEIVDGLAFDKIDMGIVNDGGLQLDLEKVGGGDPIFYIAGVKSTLDATTGGGVGGKARVALTAGSGVNTPATNYVYVTDSGGVATLVASTTIPTGAFTWVGKIVVPDATTWASTGAYAFQRYTEAFMNDGRGVISHEREKLRALGAVYISGVSQTLNITTNGGAADNVHLATGSGSIYQLHRQAVPAFSTGPYYYGNGPNIYEEITDLNAALSDSGGNSMADRRFNLVLWGAVNITTGESKLFVNLPDKDYNKDDQAQSDRDNSADYTVPDDMRSVAFMISRVALRHQTAASGTWTELGTYSLLGTPVGARSGGAGAVASNDFDDSQFAVYDNADATKSLQFELSGITTGTTRTLTMPDGSGTLGLFTGLAGGQALVGGTGTTDDLTFQTTSGVGATGADMHFNVGSNGATEALTILNNGNVGIGTTGPSKLLHLSDAINPSLRITDTTNTVNSEFRSEDSLSFLGTASNHDLRLMTNSASRLTIDNTGNIGIGVTDPDKTLEVFETVAEAQLKVSYDATRYADFQVDSVGDLVIDPQGNDVFLNDDNFLVCTGGSCPAGNPTGTGNIIVENKLGIGQTTPTSKLTIETQDGTTDFLDITSTITASAILTFDAAGNLGIGTATPVSRLAIGAGGAITTVENTLADSGTIAIDWLDGNQQDVTLGGNRTITFTNYIAGQILRLVVCQDATGSRTLAWPSSVVWNDATAPTLSTVATQCDLFAFVATEAKGSLKIFGSSALNF